MRFKNLTKYLPDFLTKKDETTFKTTSNQITKVIWMVLRVHELRCWSWRNNDNLEVRTSSKSFDEETLPTQMLACGLGLGFVRLKYLEFLAEIWLNYTSLLCEAEVSWPWLHLQASICRWAFAFGCWWADQYVSWTKKPTKSSWRCGSSWAKEGFCCSLVDCYSLIFFRKKE